MKRKIDIPATLRQQILDCLAKNQAQRLAIHAAHEKADGQISTLEEAASELARRTERLEREAITSEEASRELTQCERRASLVRHEIDKLKAARQAAPGMDGQETSATISAVLRYWHITYEAWLRDALASLGVLPQVLPLISAHSQPMVSLRHLGNNSFQFGIEGMERILQSALAGNLDLMEQAPAESPAERAADNPA